MSDVISRSGVSAWLANMGYRGLANKVMDEDRFPSAQPEIIRCRECKEWEMYGNGCQGWCGKLGLISYDDDYCGWAERREVSE